MAVTVVIPRKLELRIVRTGTEKNEPEYDPHLREEKLRKTAQQDLTPSITYRESTDENARVWVDVIAKLKNGVPEHSGFIFGRRPGGGDIVTGRISLDELEDFRPQVTSLKAATDLFVDLHYSVPAVHCDSEALRRAFPDLAGLDGSGVIVGIVDNGCDFKHKNFRLRSGDTRLLYLWDQSDHPDAEGPKPGDFGYGREFNARRINEALLQKDPYDALGYTPVIGAHGTHVMDIAAGNGGEPNLLDGRTAYGTDSCPPGVAPGADLIFVHLRTDETPSLGNSRYLLEAVDYIFSKADEENRPAVVNLSLSTSGGPHDGTTLIEQGFETLLRKPGRAIVISAGNAFARDSHVAGTVKKGTPATLQWRMDPRVAVKNEMEVWYPRDRSLKATLVAPDGERLGPVALGETYDIYAADTNTRLGRFSHRKEDPNNHDNQIDIRLPDSTEDDAANDGALWTLDLETAEADEKNVPFHAWIEQDDRGLARFEGATDSATTLGSFACSRSTLTVGAFDTFANAYLAGPYEATAAGPTRDKRQKPDVSAPGVSIVAARAQGGTTLMSGTSMAAPHVTGLVALLFQVAWEDGKHLLTTEETRNLILGAAQRSSSFGWDPQLGVGRIDGVESLRALVPEPKATQPQATPPSIPAPESVEPIYPSNTRLVPVSPGQALQGSNGHTESFGEILDALEERGLRLQRLMVADFTPTLASN